MAEKEIAFAIADETGKAKSDDEIKKEIYEKLESYGFDIPKGERYIELKRNLAVEIFNKLKLEIDKKRNKLIRFRMKLLTNYRDG